MKKADRKRYERDCSTRMQDQKRGNKLVALAAGVVVRDTRLALKYNIVEIARPAQYVCEIGYAQIVSSVCA